jgi:preprotein translocase subunit SecB|tara:strand:- start:67 stop:489 length:423 start_codon:yes stop_codon:yes gene_type:complete
MTKKYKILSNYIKDMSSETPDIETYIFVKDYISKYQLNIDINSKAVKNKMIEVNTILKFEDKQNNKKKSYFEMNYSTIVEIDDEIKEKNDLERIILCDVQIDIYPELEKSFLNLLHNSGYPDVKFEKKIDFEQLYNQRLN